MWSNGVENWYLCIVLETCGGKNSIGCRNSISSHNSQGTPKTCAIRGEHDFLILSRVVHGMVPRGMLWYLNPMHVHIYVYTIYIHVSPDGRGQKNTHVMDTCSRRQTLYHSSNRNNRKPSNDFFVFSYFVMNSPSVLYDTLETVPPEALKSAHKL